MSNKVLMIECSIISTLPEPSPCLPDWQMISGIAIKPGTDISTCRMEGHNIVDPYGEVVGYANFGHSATERKIEETAESIRKLGGVAVATASAVELFNESAKRSRKPNTFTSDLRDAFRQKRLNGKVLS